jgi:hypothetical protein
MKIENRKSLVYLMLIVAISTILTSCKKDNNDVTKPSDINEGELITTVQFRIVDTDSPYVEHIFSYRDVDGLGGNAPVIDTIKLDTGKIYSVTLLFLDESKNPIDTISNEVLAESKDHLVIYETPSTSLQITINDFDTNNPALPLGLLSSWTTSAVANTTLKVTLKHQPGIKNGDPTRGETDVEVTLPVSIK